MCATRYIRSCGPSFSATPHVTILFPPFSHTLVSRRGPGLHKCCTRCKSDGAHWEQRCATRALISRGVSALQLLADVVTGQRGLQAQHPIKSLQHSPVAAAPRANPQSLENLPSALCCSNWSCPHTDHWWILACPEARRNQCAKAAQVGETVQQGLLDVSRRVQHQVAEQREGWEFCQDYVQAEGLQAEQLTATALSQSEKS